MVPGFGMTGPTLGPGREAHDREFGAIGLNGRFRRNSGQREILRDGGEDHAGRGYYMVVRGHAAGEVEPPRQGYSVSIPPPPKQHQRLGLLGHFHKLQLGVEGLPRLSDAHPAG